MPIAVLPLSGLIQFSLRLNLPPKSPESLLESSEMLLNYLNLDFVRDLYQIAVKVEPIASGKSSRRKSRHLSSLWEVFEEP